MRNWPVTKREAIEALRRLLKSRLAEAERYARFVIERG